jgi:putative ABC transport system permease protein
LWLILLRLSVRFFRLHPGQLLALVLALAVGVGGFIAMVLINQSVLQSFTRAGDEISGLTTHRLYGEGVDFALLRRLRVDLAVPDSSAQYQTRVPAFSRYLTFYAADPLSELRLGKAAGLGTWQRATGEPALAQGVIPVWITPDLKVHVGERLALNIDGRKLVAHIQGVLPWPAVTNFIAADLADIVAANGSVPVSQIALRLNTAQAKILAAFLRDKPGIQLQEVEQRGKMLAELSRALRINLLALAALALLVATLLIYLSVRYAYLLRQADFLRMRMLGLSSAQLRRYLLLEASVLGALGGLLGLALGIGLAQILSVPLSRTLDALYRAQTQVQVRVDAWLCATALLVAIMACVLGAALPLWQSTRGSINRAMQRSAQEQTAGANRALWALPLLIPLGFYLLRQPSLIAAFAGLFALCLACLLPLPWLLAMLLKAVRPLLRRAPLALKLTHLHAQMSISRLAGALCALALALATPVGLDLMVGSFRGALSHWLEHSVVGDVFLSSESGFSKSEITLVSKFTNVQSAHYTKHVMHVDSVGPFELMVIDTAPQRLAAFEFLAGANDASFQRSFQAGEAVLISEAFANKRRLALGQSVLLDQQMRRVAGIVRDYRSEAGIIILADSAYPETRFNAINLRLQVPSLGCSEAQSWAANLDRSVNFSTRAELTTLSLRIFDQTFALTDQLKYLSAMVAALGVLAALLALQVEHASMDQRLHALGASARLRLGLRIGSALLLALLAALCAAPIGLLLAYLLASVINARAFGWTFALMLSMRPFFNLPVLALVASASALLGASMFASKAPSALYRDDL